MSGLISSNEVGTPEDPLVQAISQFEFERVRLELSKFSRRKTILFVEDDPGMQLLFGRMSDGFNCDVIYSDNYDDALKIFKDTLLDLIIVDIKLPGGRSGIDVFRKVRESSSFIPVVFFTGYLDDHEGSLIEKVGFAPIIKKPLSPRVEFFAGFLHTFGILESDHPALTGQTPKKSTP